MGKLAYYLRRRTSTGSWLPELDGLRFIAITAVLFFHMQGQLVHHGVHPVQSRYAVLAGMLAIGNRGVQLFFVISGYIIARPFAARYLCGQRGPDLRRYLTRRLTRLEPPYVVNLLVSALVIALLHHVPWTLVWRHLVTHILYLHNTIFRDDSLSLNGVTWSLEIEIQFYLLAPLLTLIFALRSAAIRRTVLSLTMLGIAPLQTKYGLDPRTILGQLQYFLAGLLLADLSLTSMRHWSHNERWDVVSLAGWPLLLLPDTRWQDMWFPFLMLLLCVAAMRGQSVYRFLRLKWIAIFGGMCYTIYLWHPLVLSFVQRLLDRVQPFLPTDYALYFLVQGIPKLIGVALISGVLFALIERPCMDPEWPRKLWAWCLWHLRTREADPHQGFTGVTANAEYFSRTRRR